MSASSSTTKIKGFIAFIVSSRSTRREHPANCFHIAVTFQSIRPGNATELFRQFPSTIFAGKVCPRRTLAAHLHHAMAHHNRIPVGRLAGTLLGALTGYVSLARKLLAPLLQSLRNIPSMAWAPLFLLWLGIRKHRRSDSFRLARSSLCISTSPQP